MEDTKEIDNKLGGRKGLEKDVAGRRGKEKEGGSKYSTVDRPVRIKKTKKD